MGGEHSQQISNYVNHSTNCTSTTAFYQAVHKAAHDMSNDAMSNSNQWIIALTDGDDNCSSRGGVDSNKVIRYIQQEKVNLIIITVRSLSNEPEIKRMAAASPKGMHIPAGSNTSAISDAFGEATKFINGQITLEVL